MSFFIPQPFYLQVLLTAFVRPLNLAFCNPFFFFFLGFAIISTFLEAGLQEVGFLSPRLTQTQVNGILLLSSGSPALLPSLLIFKQSLARLDCFVTLSVLSGQQIKAYGLEGLPVPHSSCLVPSLPLWGHIPLPEADCSLLRGATSRAAVTVCSPSGALRTFPTS